MNVVLDTNVIQEDFSWKSKKRLLFIEFLNATRTRVVMPEIVLKETKANYLKELISHKNSIEHSINAINKLLVKETVGLPALNIKKQVDEYIDHLLKKLFIQNKDVIKTKDDYMQDLLNRCIERRKPFTENGEEFRDAILWLSVLDLADDDRKKEIIFISGNTKQFGLEKNKLFKELIDEANVRKTTVHYYSNLTNFLEETSSVEIDFIDEAWIEENLDIKSELEEAQKSNEEWTVGDEIESYPVRKIIKRIEEVTLLGYKIKNFKCYKLPNEEIYIDLQCDAEFEISISIEERIREREPDGEYVYYTQSDTDSYTTESEYKIEVIVKGKEIIDANIV